MSVDLIVFPLDSERSKKGEARKETDSLCSDDEMGEGMAKP
jgi:hypothetical protein